MDLERQSDLLSLAQPVSPLKTFCYETLAVGSLAVPAIAVFRVPMASVSLWLLILPLVRKKFDDSQILVVLDCLMIFVCYPVDPSW